MSRLSDHQLHEAFRAGGYDRATAERFVRALRMRIADGRHAGSRLRGWHPRGSRRYLNHA
jgi:hypothetical protein